ncbi:MAG: hypothetical protein ACO2O6_05540 [Candidatus Hydrothermia bacterium]|jgi:hypothetical protein
MNIEHGLKDQEQKSKHLKEDKAFEILKIYGFNFDGRFKRKLFRFRKKF